MLNFSTATITSQQRTEGISPLILWQLRRLSIDSQNVCWGEIVWHHPLRFLTAILTVGVPSSIYFWLVDYSWCASILVRLNLVIYFNESIRTNR